VDKLTDMGCHPGRHCNTQLFLSLVLVEEIHSPFQISAPLLWYAIGMKMVACNPTINASNNRNDPS
jgi:hypothetical protein